MLIHSIVFIYLITEKLNINKSSGDSYTPLQYAIINHSLEVASYIISVDPTLCQNLDNKRNIIWLVCVANEPSLLSTFLQKGADLTKLKNQYDDLMLACCQHKSFTCLQILLENITDKECLEKAIHRAIQNDDIPFVRLLIKGLQGSKNYQKVVLTAFKLSCELRRVYIAKEIAPLFVDINVQDKDSTPLHIAIATLSPSLVSLILQKNPKFDLFDVDGRPPAHRLADAQPPCTLR